MGAGCVKHDGLMPSRQPHVEYHSRKWGAEVGGGVFPMLRVGMFFFPSSSSANCFTRGLSTRPSFAISLMLPRRAALIASGSVARVLKHARAKHSNAVREPDVRILCHPPYASGARRCTPVLRLPRASRPRARAFSSTFRPHSSPQAKRVVLQLQDGTHFEGVSFGAEKDVAGEVVFSTGMVGVRAAPTPRCCTDACAHACAESSNTLPVSRP